MSALGHHGSELLIKSYGWEFSGQIYVMPITTNSAESHITIQNVSCHLSLLSLVEYTQIYVQVAWMLYVEVMRIHVQDSATSWSAKHCGFFHTLDHLMLDQHSSTAKLLFITLWLLVGTWSNFYTCCLGSHNLWCEFSRIDEQNFLRCRLIKNDSPLFACFSDAVVTWPCVVIAISHLLNMNF